MKKFLLAFLITLFFLRLSYFVNNSGQCCDQIFEAGWPFPYYGGSGGIMGNLSNKIIIGGLLFDLLFWFPLSITLVFILTAIKKLLRKKSP
ncbi:MAG: hypothetical protein HYW86_02990 [Candidatus Roizmanbacteria bacterium]|nr:MAG: hypothetical protein HYW86_02990 [Candidatus Roizmanbacteria bacterium]